jgi:lipopolysaccharide heptosyltransferase I
MPVGFKNILIIKPSSLGDIVLALPALSALRRSFPDAEISWLVRPEFEPILKNHPDLNHTILFDRKLLGKAWFSPSALTALSSLVKTLRRSRFDIVIDLQGLFRSGLLAWLTGCKTRLGMANARELAPVFYMHKISQSEDAVHLVDYYLKIVRQTGIADTAVKFTLPVNSAAEDSVRKLLDTHNAKIGNYAVLILGSARSNKCWPIDRFAALADKINAAFGLSVIAAGSASERELAEKLGKLAAVPVINFAGLTNLAELTALLKSAKIVVSGDTGPGHIAAALNVPQVMIIGRTNPARIAPYGRPNCVAAVEPYARGFKINSDDPKHDIKAVTVDDVYQKVCGQI